MTGYGRATADIGGPSSVTQLAVEIRSVNNRGLDLKIRSEEPDGFCDAEITRVVRTAVERGTVAVVIRRERPGRGVLDTDRIRRLHHALELLRRDAGIATPVDLATVGAFLGQTDTSENLIRGEEMWYVLRPVVETAVADLIATRDREGAALQAELTARAEHLRDVVSRIAGAVDLVPARFARRIEERVAALRDIPGFDPGRVAQEIALMADRLDVSEELLRLATHLEHLRALLNSVGAVGRKLDFVIQEIGREINTVGSKAQDATVAAQVIEGKAELEKIREQAQNIE